MVLGSIPATLPVVLPVAYWRGTSSCVVLHKIYALIDYCFDYSLLFDADFSAQI